MSRNDSLKFWRSLDSLLNTYAQGELGRLEFFAALTGLADIINPETIYEHLPMNLREDFLKHTLAVVGNDRMLYNVVTGEPLPAEAFARLTAWAKAISPPDRSGPNGGSPAGQV